MQGTTELGNESGIESEDAGLVSVGDHRDPSARGNIRTTLAMLACVGIAVTMLWSFTMPNLRGPDEGQHLDLIFEMTENHSFTTSKDYKLHMRMYVIRAIAFHGDAGSLHGLGTAAKPRDQRPAFSATPDDRCVDLPPPNDIRCSNQLNQHPPLGWGSAVVGSELVGIFSEPSDWSYDKYLLLLRFLNALHMGLVGPLIYLTVRRLRGSHAVALLGGLLPLAVPQAPNLSGMMSNDGLLLVVGAGFAYCVARLVTGDYKARSSIGFGIVVAVALLTKAWGLLLLPTMAFVFVGQWCVDRRHRFEIALAALTTSAVALALGGWWWIRNVIVEGTVQPHHAVFKPVPVGFVPTDSWFWIRRASAWLTRRFWGWFGTFAEKVRLPLWLVALATIVALVLVLLAYVRSTTPIRIFATAGVGLFFVNSAEVLRQARVLHVEHSGFQGIQGRYMFIALPMLAVVCAFGARCLAGRWERFLPAVGFGAAAVMEVFGLAAVMRAYWGPPNGSFRDQVWALRQWTAIGSLGAGLSLLAIGSAIAWCAWLCRPRRESLKAEG